MKQSLCEFKNIYKLIFQFEHKVKKETGYSINELLILCTLKSGKSTTSQLAEELGVTPGRISKIISSLEEQDLLKRTLGEEDKRHMYFTATDKAALVLEKFMNSGIEIPEIYIKNNDNKGDKNE